MKAIILARVSTNEQKDAGNSLPAQIDRMRAYCNRLGFSIFKEYELSESAYKKRRDEFDKILDDIESSNEKIAVCFDKVDRLSRNVFDKRVSKLYEKAIADEIELHFVSDGQVINNQISAVEKFQFGMSLGLAKYYSDAISDNVKRVFEKRRKDGLRTGGRVKIGYIHIEDENGSKNIIPDPERAHLIVKLFELYSTGNYSLDALVKESEKMGLKSRDGYKLSKSVIQSILKETFYYGVQSSKKYKPYRHIYEPIISQELFEKCQDVMHKRSNNSSKIISDEFIFKGLLTCQHCGCSITPEKHTKKSGKEYIYYSCTNAKGICKREYVNEKLLLKSVYETLDKLSNISQDNIEFIKDKLRETTEAEVVYHKKQIARIQKEYTDTQKKIDRLMDLYLENTSITKDEYDKKLLELKDRQEKLNLELEEYTKADYDFLTTVSTVLSLAQRAKEIFESSEIDEKRQLLNYLLQNPYIKDKKLYFTMKKPFNMLLNIPKSSAMCEW